MKTIITVLLILGYIIAGIVVLVLHGRKKLAPEVSDMFDMLLIAAPGFFVFAGVLLWPLPLIVGMIGNKLSLRTSLKPGDGEKK